MKIYDGLNNSFGTHTVRVSLQDGEYKGFFDYKISGNCKGIDVLDFDIDNYDKPDLKKLKTYGMEIDLSGDFYTVVLRNEKEDTCEYELDSAELGRMIVAIEIIDFEEE